MFQVFMIVFALLGSFGAVFSGELVVKKFQIPVDIECIAFNPLRQIDQIYVKACNDFNIQCTIEEPFVEVSRFWGNLKKGQKNLPLGDAFLDEISEINLKLDKRITYLPFGLFFNESKVKTKGSKIFEFKKNIAGQDCLFEVVLGDQDLNKLNPNLLIRQFEANPMKGVMLENLNSTLIIERLTEVILAIDINQPSAGLFILSGLKNRTLCEAFGIISKANDPFIPLTDKPKELVGVKALPASCFLSSLNDRKFKKPDEDLFSFVKENESGKILYRVRLKDCCCLDRYSIQQFFDQFHKTPNLLSDADKDKEELVKAGIIELDSSGFGVWPKKSTPVESSSSFSSLKKSFFYFMSFVIVAALLKQYFSAPVV